MRKVIFIPLIAVAIWVLWQQQGADSQPQASQVEAKIEAVQAQPGKTAPERKTLPDVQAALDSKSAEMADKIPQDVKAKLAAGVQNVAESDLIANAIKTGSKAPAFTLPNAMGGNTALAALLEKGPVIVTWYRGGWCPYCNTYLNALQASLPEFENRGAQLVAISPELPEHAMNTAENQALGFHVLSDVESKVSKGYGVVFTLSPDIVAIYKQFGIDLQVSNGNDRNELPLAATYVIGQDGTVLYHFLNADYTKRADLNAILAALP